MAQLTGFKQDNIGAYIIKDPAATLDYTVDWTDWLPAAEVVSSATVTITNTVGDSTSLSVDSTAINDNKKVTANISGGEGGQIYNVEYTITTDGGLTDSRNFRIKCVERQL